jgi:hypothetical protein
MDPHLVKTRHGELGVAKSPDCAAFQPCANVAYVAKFLRWSDGVAHKMNRSD